jgi:protein-tyrosine-phosphatase
MDIEARARVHAALGDLIRLAMVDALLSSDRTFQELADAVGLKGNLAAHHIGVLDAAGLIERHVSEGDRRHRYLSLRRDRLEGLVAPPPVAPGSVLFVCTHNSARSVFAAALWRARTGRDADSAGTEPADRVHPTAVQVAAEYGLHLDITPKGYTSVSRPPGLIVSVCDRARESGLPFAAPSIHWSIPDPVRAGTLSAFRTAFSTLAERIDHLAAAKAG